LKPRLLNGALARDSLQKTVDGKEDRPAFPDAAREEGVRNRGAP